MTDANDPKRWMQGFPPAPDVWVRFDDPRAAQFPQLRWALNHYRELAPTKTVRRAASPSVLPRAAQALFCLPMGKCMTSRARLKQLKNMVRFTHY